MIMRSLTPAELSARSKRNLAIAGALVALMMGVSGPALANSEGRHEDRPPDQGP